jgi:hypothetical protein
MSSSAPPFCSKPNGCNRQRAIDFIQREVEAARGNGLNARMLVPLTRGHGDGTALQFEVELTHLDQLDQLPQPWRRLNRRDSQLDARIQRDSHNAALRRNSSVRRDQGVKATGSYRTP